MSIEKTSDLLLYVLVGIFLLAVVVALVVLSGAILAWAWNAVMPYLFHLPSIRLIHGIALSLLLGALVPCTTVRHSHD